TRVPSESGVQVFAPIWKVNVSNEQNYFVNAIAGFTFYTEEEDFLSEAIETKIDRVQVTRKKDSPISEIIDDLKERAELLEGDGEDYAWIYNLVYVHLGVQAMHFIWHQTIQSY